MSTSEEETEEYQLVQRISQDPHDIYEKIKEIVGLPDMLRDFSIEWGYRTNEHYNWEDDDDSPHQGYEESTHAPGGNYVQHWTDGLSRLGLCIRKNDAGEIYNLQNKYESDYADADIIRELKTQVAVVKEEYDSKHDIDVRNALSAITTGIMSLLEDNLDDEYAQFVYIFARQAQTVVDALQEIHN